MYRWMRVSTQQPLIQTLASLWLPGKPVGWSIYKLSWLPSHHRCIGRRANQQQQLHSHDPFQEGKYWWRNQTKDRKGPVPLRSDKGSKTLVPNRYPTK